MSKQSTFDGDAAQAVPCEYYDGCQGHAKWEIEVFQFDGFGWVYQDTLACQSCYEEEFELEFKDPGERARELKPFERWSGNGDRTEGSD